MKRFRSDENQLLRLYPHSLGLKLVIHFRLVLYDRQVNIPRKFSSLIVVDNLASDW